MALKLVANTICGRSMDGVQAADSGHPGMPMGMADVAAVIGTQYLRHNHETPERLMFATASEVGITLTAAQKLGEEVRSVRVVSMPSWELFEKQDVNCERYVGRRGVVVSKDDFGASVPFRVLLEEFGFTTGNLCEKAATLLGWTW